MPLTLVDTEPDAEMDAEPLTLPDEVTETDLEPLTLPDTDVVTLDVTVSVTLTV